MTQPPVITAEFLAKDDTQHQPVSVNMIVKGNPEAVAICLDSVYGANLVKKGTKDECILVDTGSSIKDFNMMKTLEKVFPQLRVIKRHDLAVDYEPLCQKYLDSELYNNYKEYIGNGRGLLSFSDARNVALEASKNDLIFWIDSDDVLAENKQGLLRKAINYTFGKTKLQQIFLDYDYEFGEDGTCTTTLRRERIFRKSLFTWKGNCHETAIPREGAVAGPVAFFEAVQSKIVHTEARKPHNISDIRNYLILRDEFERTQADGTLDPRTIFYLGNSARGLKRFAEAHQYYSAFDFQSGSLDDRYAALSYRANMYMDPEIQRPFDAMDKFLKCIELKPQDPRGYFGLSRVYAAVLRHQAAVHWYEIGTRLRLPENQVFSHDPTQIHYHPHIIAAHSYKELHESKRSIECMTKAAQFRPNSKEAQRLMGFFQNNAVGEQLHSSIATITQGIRYPGGLDAKRVATQICDELSHVPPSMEKQGVGKVEPPEGRSALPDINLYCGGSGEDWGAFCRESGTGGSEKMVILLAEALQATGQVNVNVYAEVPFQHRGISEATGVNWRHWSEFDLKRPREAMIFWRCAGAVIGVMCPAKIRVLWNHDVQNPAEYTEELLEMLDFVQFQSKFHTVPVKDVIPEEKVWIARNALEPLPQNVEAPKRNAKQVLYCSSPDRGLLTAAEVVRRAQVIDPEISLVVTYGVTPWARKIFAQQNHKFVPDLGRDLCMDDYERKIRSTLDDLGAVVLNRVGFKKMQGLMLTSGVWLYPTRFPEISCMSAMEAQESGMVVLATRYGALEETIAQTAFPHLPALPERGAASDEWFDAAAKMLVDAVNVPAENHMRKNHATLAASRFNIKDLASEWITKLGLNSESAVSETAQEAIVQPAESFKGEENGIDVNQGSDRSCTKGSG